MAAYVPDADPDQSYFKAVIADNVGWAEAYANAVLSDVNNVFGYLGTGTEGYYAINDPNTQALSGFSYQQAYLAYGIHRCKQHGHMTTSILRDGLARTELLRIQSDPQFPKELGMPYNFGFARMDLGNIFSIGIGPTSVIEVFGAHNLNTGDSITISGSNSTPSIDGTYVVTVTSLTQFTIPTTVTVAGTAGTITGMPVSSSVMTRNDGVTTRAIKYYTSWAQIYESTKDAWANSDLVAQGQIYSPDQYFLMQCANQAGLPGAAAAMAFAASFTPYATFGAFSMAKF
jgi:hypothetical protein